MDRGGWDSYYRRMRTRTAVALILVAFLIGGIIAGGVGWWFMRRAAGPKVGNTATVIQQIQSLSELVTVKFVMQKVVIFTNASTTTLGQLSERVNTSLFGPETLVLLAHGVAKAGVDLARLAPEDVYATGSRISIRLPHAMVTDVYLDETQTQILDRKTGLLRSFDKTLEAQARQEAWRDMNRQARQAGIEREAEQRAREQVERLLHSMGFSTVEFR